MQMLSLSLWLVLKLLIAGKLCSTYQDLEVAVKPAIHLQLTLLVVLAPA